MDRYDKDYECPRCGYQMTPEEVVNDSRGTACPRCGDDDHPAYAALDRLEGQEEGNP
jgi:DNA-directed RNA polymerase subunit RPC12/RpoP